MPDAVIRPATLLDAKAIAQIHVSVWRATYDAFAPQSIKDHLENRRGEAYWSDELSKVFHSHGHEEGIFVAQGEGEGVCGFVRYGRASQVELEAGGEIKHLYVASDQQGQQIGAKLLRSGLLALKSAGSSMARLAVVKQNPRALAFYERHGGQTAGEFRDVGPLWRSDNVIVQWQLKDVV